MTEDPTFSTEQLRALTKQAVAPFCLSIGDRELDQLTLYADMLRACNRKMNLTAITDEEGIAVRHFADSLSVLPVLRKERAGIDPSRSSRYRLLDVGTGAGFPGIPLRIMESEADQADPAMTVLLMDTLAKRVRFLQSVVDDLHLPGITAVHARAEDAARDPKTGLRESFDFVVARAVAALPVLLEYTLPFVRVGGLMVAMKGSHPEQEVAIAEKALRTFGGRIESVETFSLDGDMARSLICVRKTAPCPARWPRSAGKPEKAPVL